jgi:xanthosine utilization system XapX-like protein
MKKKLKPIVEGLAVGIVFFSITLLFEIPFIMSIVIGLLASLGGYRNSIKMDKEEK